MEERYKTIKNGLAEIGDKMLEHTAKRENIAAFLKTLEQSGTLLTEFDEALWNAMVESVTVYTEHELSLCLKMARRWRGKCEINRGRGGKGLR